MQEFFAHAKSGKIKAISSTYLFLTQKEYNEGSVIHCYLVYHVSIKWTFSQTFTTFYVPTKK